MKKIYVLLSLLLCAAITQAQTKQELNESARKLGIAQYAISKLYVDSIHLEEITESAIKGMLLKLDPHSTYTNAEETKSFSEPLEGNFDGIGVQFNMIEDTLVVIQTVDKGPSQKAGIMAGDRIIRVNDTLIAGVKMPQTKIMKKLRGKKGTTVHLGIRRMGVKEEIKFDVIRDKIPLHTLDAAYMIAPKVGFIRFGSFGKTTAKEIHDALDNLKGQGAESMIIDVRSNGGGFLEPAIEVANEFLEKGDMVVYTKGRAVPSVEYRARGGGIFTKGKVVVLVDEFTASAAEILSGALQDQDRAMIVGLRSFGKGLVQQPIPLPDRSMIRLTVARYYTPAGRCIQKPYKPGENEAYSLDVINRLNSGELTHADSIHHNDSLRCYTLRKHRAVYGGGGIIPDYFVPLDTTINTQYYRQLSRKNIVLPAGLKYIDRHRDELKKEYTSFAKFKKNYEFPDKVIDGIFKKGEESKITPKNDNERNRTRKLIKKILKAITARDIWDMTQYFEIMNENDATIDKALDILKQ